MSKKVNVYVSVTHPKTGLVTNLAPGDEVPDGITVGDHVYAEQDQEELPVAGPGQSMTKERAAELAKLVGGDSKAEDKAGAKP